MDDQKEYEVLKPFQYEGVMLEAGATVSMPEIDAIPLIEGGEIRLVQPPTPEVPKAEATASAAAAAASQTDTISPSQGAAPAQSTPEKPKEEKKGWLGGHTVGRDDTGPNGSLRQSGLRK